MPGYDYRRPGWYFITICTREKEPFFGCIQQGHMRLSPLGAIVQTCWQSIPIHYKHVTLDEFVVMPDHIHGLLHLGIFDIRGARENFGRPVSGSLAAILRSYKAAATVECRKSEEAFGWHTSYHDRIVRDTRALRAIRAYIRANPRRWSGPQCDDP